MPETRSQALRRARELGFPKSTVVQAKNGDWFIAPQGIKSQGAKVAYANCRLTTSDKAKCASIAWSIENKINKK